MESADKSTTEKVAENVGETVKETLDSAKQKAGSTLNQAQRAVGGIVSDTVGEVKSAASNVVGQTTQEAQAAIDQQKERTADRIENVASALRQTGAQLEAQDQAAIAQYTDAAAEQLERFSEFLKNRNASELWQEVDRFARRQPELFVAGALAGGFLLGRFLKSSSERSRDYGQQMNYGQNMGYRQNQYGNQYGTPSGYYGSSSSGSSGSYGGQSSGWQGDQPDSMPRHNQGAVEAPQPSSGQVTETYRSGDRVVAQQTYESYESEPHLGEDEGGSQQRGKSGTTDPYETQVKQADVNENRAPGTAKRDPYQDPGPR
jgi:ElaB/YqjD/DUF883 family membrane-anchored ribosome-binding protein